MQKEHTLNRPDREAMNRVLAENPCNVEGVILRLAWKQGLTRDEIRTLTWNAISFTDDQLILDDRTIPLDAETRESLKMWYAFRGSISDYVVISARLRKQMLPESISRSARVALDRGGLHGISLVDLRRDFIISQLEEHDWPYAARVSGVSPPALYAQFSAYMSLDRSGTPKEDQTQQVDEFRLWKVLQSEEDLLVKAAVWMAWKMGMYVKEIVSLTWDQVDFEENKVCLVDRTIPLNATVCRLLLEMKSRSQGVDDPHVMLTPNSNRPIDQPRLSKIVRTALIRGGMEHIKLGDLNKEEKREKDDAKILRYVSENGTISRREVMLLLGLQKVAAYERLRRLTAQRKLVRVGAKYYLAGTVIPPEEQYERIRSHLEQVGCAYRQELAELLHIETRKCGLILKHLVEEEKLVQKGQRYYLPSDELMSHPM